MARTMNRQCSPSMRCSLSHSAARRDPPTCVPFLENVLRGRRVSPERVDEVAHHYACFGGVSPLTELTMKQAAALEDAFSRADVPLPVDVGMRNWHPFLADTMTRHVGERRTTRDRRARRGAAELLRLPAVQGERPRCAHRCRGARGAPARRRLRRRLARASQGSSRRTPTTSAKPRRGCRRTCAISARLIFTAHSIPDVDGGEYPYDTLRSRNLLASASGSRWPSGRLTRSVGHSSTRAAADVPATVARAGHRRLPSSLRRSSSRSPLPRRLSVRPRRGALRSRRRSGGRVPAIRHRDGTCGRGERRIRASSTPLRTPSLDVYDLYDGERRYRCPWRKTGVRRK